MRCDPLPFCSLSLGISKAETGEADVVKTCPLIKGMPSGRLVTLFAGAVEKVAARFRSQKFLPAREFAFERRYRPGCK